MLLSRLFLVSERIVSCKLVFQNKIKIAFNVKKKEIACFRIALIVFFYTGTPWIGSANVAVYFHSRTTKLQRCADEDGRICMLNTVVRAKDFRRGIRFASKNIIIIILRTWWLTGAFKGDDYNGEDDDDAVVILSVYDL